MEGIKKLIYDLFDPGVEMQSEPDDWVENVRMLEASLGAVVPEDGSLLRVREQRGNGAGFDPTTWRIIAEMGWLALRTKEDDGGLGLGLREATALCAGLGRGLVPEPVISAILALRLMSAAGVGAPEAALTGETIMLAAWQGGASDCDPTAGVTVSDGRLNGRKIAVEGGLGADIFVVTLAEGIAVVPKDTPGLTVTGQQMHDGTFLAQLDFADVSAEVLPCAGMTTFVREAMLMHAAYLMALSERAFEITLDYLRMRKQFDVPIGQFQALQHRATEIKVQLELARAAIGAAGRMLDRSEDWHLAQMAILRARSRAGGLARLMAREAIQMHGAIGYTDEADIGLFARKAMVSAGRYGVDTDLRRQFSAMRDEREKAQ